MIELKQINKTFRVAKRDSGFREAVKALFKKEYTYVEALKDISFKIKDGEMVGYIGPNGAGKSSTIKIMSGILNPDSGSCVVNGLIPWKDRTEYVNQIGVVFGQRSQLWWDVPVIDSFELLRDIYKVEERAYRNRLAELTELLQIEDIIRTPTRQLSLGQRMRCEIAASLLHNPKILFLDEPTIGLDAVSKISVRKFIQKINKEHNTTVILTTHDMQDIEALTERVVLIGKGRILLDGSLFELKNRNIGQKVISVDYIGNIGKLAEGMSYTVKAEGHAVVSVDTNRISVPQAICCLSEQTDIQDLNVGGAGIEEIVVSLYEEFAI